MHPGYNRRKPRSANIACTTAVWTRWSSRAAPCTAHCSNPIMIKAWLPESLNCLPAPCRGVQPCPESEMAYHQTKHGRWGGSYSHLAGVESNLVLPHPDPFSFQAFGEHCDSITCLVKDRDVQYNWVSSAHWWYQTLPANDFTQRFHLNVKEDRIRTQTWGLRNPVLQEPTAQSLPF